MTWAGLGVHPRGLFIATQKATNVKTKNITTDKFVREFKAALSEPYRTRVQLMPCLTDKDYRETRWLEEKGNISLAGFRNNDPAPETQLFVEPESEERSVESMMKSIMFDIADSVTAEHHMRYLTEQREDGSFVHDCGSECPGWGLQWDLQADDAIYVPNTKIVFKNEYINDEGTLYRQG